MNKCHVPITWVNDQAPAINDTHLNQYDGELDTLDDRIITLDTTKALQSDMLLAFKDVSLNSTTGVITFTLFNNTTKTIDTLLEKIAINFDYDDDPTSPHYQNLIIELEDGTYKYIDMSALITEYEFTDSSTIDFTVTSGAVSASVIDGSITSSKLDPAFAVTIADAEANGLKSEGYANGTQGGVPVTSGPYYENNAKYWKEQAQAIASQSLSGLTDVTITTPTDGQALVYDANSGEWVNGASASSASDISYDNTASGLTATDVQDAVDEVNGAMQYLYNNTGGKNLNSYPYYETSKTENGLTFTDNGDGTITIKAASYPFTVSTTTTFTLHSRYNTYANGCVLKNGNYILSGCPQGGSSSTYYMRTAYIDSNYSAQPLGPDDTGNGADLTVNGGYYSPDSVYAQIVIGILAGTVLTQTLTFKPMIRDASISDDTYVPYAMTNRELTEKVKGIISAATNAADFAAFKTAIANL